jgi:hypothetical protein
VLELLFKMPSGANNLPSWVWTTAASVVTYISGLFTKPITESIGKVLDTRRDRKRLRKSLYKELGFNLERMHYFIILKQGQTVNVPRVEEWERREVYDHALKDQPLVFRELKEANPISDFYMQLQHLRGMDIEKQRYAIVGINTWIEASVKQGRLSRRLLNASYTLGRHKLFLHPMLLSFQRWAARMRH